MQEREREINHLLHLLFRQRLISQDVIGDNTYKILDWQRKLTKE